MKAGKQIGGHQTQPLTDATTPWSARNEQGKCKSCSGFSSEMIQEPPGLLGSYSEEK